MKPILSCDVSAALGTLAITSSVAQLVCAAVASPEQKTQWLRAATASFGAAVRQVLKHEAGWIVTLVVRRMLEHIASQLPQKQRKMKTQDSSQYDGAKLRKQAEYLMVQLKLLGI